MAAGLTSLQSIEIRERKIVINSKLLDGFFLNSHSQHVIEKLLKDYDLLSVKELHKWTISIQLIALVIAHWLMVSIITQTNPDDRDL